jgi:hypothetical protein
MRRELEESTTMSRPYFETVWTFKTARFTVALELSECQDDPADSFDDQRDVDAIRNGLVEWFDAQVSVYLDKQCVGSDSLGGCSYTTMNEFWTAHRDPDPLNRNSSIMRAAKGDNVCICHYFPSMVQQALTAARKNICNMPQLRRFEDTRNANHVDGYDRDDLGESPDY